MNVKILGKSKIDNDTLINVASFFGTFLENKAMVPGKVENWDIIFDLKGIGLTNVPKKTIKAVIGPM